MVTARADGLVIPTSEDRKDAEKALAGLAPMLKDKPTSTRVLLRPEGAARSELVVLPHMAFDLLRQILEQLAAGNAMTLVPVHAELTTQEAADILNVSRPFLIRLLVEGKLQFRLVGTHRRIRAADLFCFKEKDDDERRRAADELTQTAQDLGLGY